MQSHTRKSEIYVTDLNTRFRSWRVTDNPNASSPQWLGHSDQLIWLESLENGHTNFVISDARLVTETYIVGTVPGPVSNLIVTNVAFIEDQDDELGFVIMGKANSDGSLFNPVLSKESSENSTGRFYTTLPGRHADTLHCPQKDAFWFGDLFRPSGSPAGRYSMGRINNLINYFSLGNVELRMAPGKKDCPDLAVNAWMIAFVGNDPVLSRATHPHCFLYVCPLLRWDGFPLREPYHAFKHRGLGGLITSPTLRPDSETVAFLSKKADGYDSDKNRILFIYDHYFHRGEELFESEDGKGEWDLSPSAISYGVDGSLLIQVEEKGRRVLYKYNFDSWPEKPSPKYLRLVSGLLSENSVMDVTPVEHGSVKFTALISYNSFVHGRQCLLIDTSSGNPKSQSEQDSRPAETNNSKRQIDEIWLEGANKRQVHAWIIRPSDFRPDKKYPLAFFIHDGPQSAWLNQWSIYWNLMLFAEQGYIVVAPNPTGSTGYGQDFTDAIQGSWGGLPYIDLQKVFDHIKENLDYVDTERAVAIGNGYGGYIINWMQGHEFGRRLKAFVTYDGIFNMMTQLASDTQSLLIHDMKGPPWTSLAEWQKWDPAQHTAHWKTPHLIIHNGLDFRQPIAQGLAAFHTLQMRDVRSAFLTFPDEDDQIRKPENLLLWYHTVIRWMNQHVKSEINQD